MNAASKSPEAPSDGARTKKFDRPAQEAQRKYSPGSRALTRGKRPRCKSQSEGEKQGLPANYQPMGGAVGRGGRMMATGERARATRLWDGSRTLTCIQGPGLERRNLSEQLWVFRRL